VRKYQPSCPSKHNSASSGMTKFLNLLAVLQRFKICRLLNAASEDSDFLLERALMSRTL